MFLLLYCVCTLSAALCSQKAFRSVRLVLMVFVYTVSVDALPAVCVHNALFIHLVPVASGITVCVVFMALCVYSVCCGARSQCVWYCGTMELPPHDVGVEDGGMSGGRKHCGAETCPGHSPHCPQVRRAHCGSWLPTWCDQHPPRIR